MNESWNNYSALGYVIRALGNLCYSQNNINMVIVEMLSLFDELTLVEAKQIFYENFF